MAANGERAVFDDGCGFRAENADAIRDGFT
jgi:hypothetical protein